MTHDISETLVIYVAASHEAVVEALRGIDQDGDPFAGLAEDVEIAWELSIEADDDGGCFLSSTRHYVAGDDDARAALFSGWRQFRRAADAAARQTLRTIKRRAEAVERQEPVLLAA